MSSFSFILEHISSCVVSHHIIKAPTVIGWKIEEFWLLQHKYAGILLAPPLVAYPVTLVSLHRNTIN